MTTSDTRYNLTLLNIKYVLSPVWGGERQGERLHVRGEGLGWGADLRADRHRADPCVPRVHPLHLLPRHLLHRRLQVFGIIELS